MPGRVDHSKQTKVYWKKMVSGSLKGRWKFLNKRKVSKSTVTKQNIEDRRYRDGVYKSYLLGKFTNNLIKRGAKTKPEAWIYYAAAQLKLRSHSSPIFMYFELLFNIKPFFIIQGVQVSGRIIYFPTLLGPKRQLRISIRWLRDLLIKYEGHGLQEKMSNLFINMQDNVHNSLSRKRDEVTERAIEERLNLRYSWIK